MVQNEQENSLNEEEEGKEDYRDDGPEEEEVKEGGYKIIRNRSELPASMGDMGSTTFTRQDTGLSN